MPNRSSHAQNVPQRTCVACRQKKELGQLLSFFILREGIVFDPGRQVQCRRYYVCRDTACLLALDKWRRQYLKRHFAVNRAATLFSGAPGGEA